MGGFDAMNQPALIIIESPMRTWTELERRLIIATTTTTTTTTITTMKKFPGPALPHQRENSIYHLCKYQTENEMLKKLLGPALPHQQAN